MGGTCDCNGIYCNSRFIFRIWLTLQMKWLCSFLLLVSGTTEATDYGIVWLSLLMMIWLEQLRCCNIKLSILSGLA